MTPDPQLEAWLATATAGLALVSVAQVRAEISSHYESALAAGDTPEEAIHSLGDPKQAKREYRRVLLTEFEAPWADLVRANAPPGRHHWSSNVVWGALIVWALVSHAPLWTLWILGAIIVIDIARDWFLQSEPVLRHSKSAQHILVWLWFCCRAYTHDGLGSMFAFLACSAAIFLCARRIRRKLAGQPTLVPDPARDHATAGPPLTSAESRFLRMLQRESERPAWSTYLLLLLTVAGYVGFLLGFISAARGKHPSQARYVGAVFTALTAALLFHVLSLRGSFLQTPERGPLFRRVKWTMVAIAVLTPPVTAWMFGRGSPGSDDFRAVFTGLFYFVLFVAFFPEYMRVSLRRKLPESQWPKGLYL